MGMPKNGYELAAMLGYGDLYKKAEAQQENDAEMTEDIKKMMGKMDSIFKRNIQDVID